MMNTRTNVGAMLVAIADEVSTWSPTDRRVGYVTDQLIRIVKQVRQNDEDGLPIDASVVRDAAVLAVDEMEMDNMSKGMPDPLDGQSAVARISRAANSPRRAR